MHRWVLAVMALSLLRAGDGPLDRATLRGVKGMNVVIDHLDADLEKAGLTQDMLRSRIENRLRRAGIAIDPKAIEFVGLRVDSFLAKRGPDSLGFTLGFYQPVLLVRDQKVRTACPTWDVQSILMVAPKPMVESALETVDQLSDRFANAFQEANRQ